MKYFEATFSTIIIRYYLMMAVAIIAGLANAPWLGLLCLPIFLSAILGIKFGKEQTKYPRTSKMEIRKSSPAEIAAAA